MYTIDPESFTWSPFDNYKYELDRRPYMSLSHDSTLEATTKAGGGVEAHPSDEEKEASNVIPPIGEEDMSLFDVHMPGVLTLQQLEEQVDLDHWKLLAHGVLVDMIVSYLFLVPFLHPAMYIFHFGQVFDGRN